MVKKQADAIVAKKVRQLCEPFRIRITGESLAAVKEHFP